MSTMITYIHGDATAPPEGGVRVIAHVCNDIGGWGKGFVLALSKRWKAPEQAYRDWHAGKAMGDEEDAHYTSGEFALGEVQLVRAEAELYVANMVAQRGIRRSGGKPPIRYEAVDLCLSKLGKWAAEHEAAVHMPRIGCGLAGGDWSQIEPLLMAQLCEREVPVTVYDFG